MLSKKHQLITKSMLLSGLAVMSSAGISQAQQNDTANESQNSIVLDEIIVTAQRRQQTIQDVPASVSAISGLQLEQNQITDVLDLQYSIPNISIATNTGTANGARIFLRGVGEDESRASAEPAVGVYVDGIYVGRQVGALFDLVDLERVEVLRGPQGTLYGRNSNGGAIKLISRTPSTEKNEFDLGITAGSDSRFDTKLVGNLALSDSTAVRASFISKSRDGFHTLNPNGDFAALAGTEVGEIDTTAFRISLAHQLSDSWSANLIIDSTQDDSDPVPDSNNVDSDADGNLFTVEPTPGTVCSAATPSIFLGIGCFTDYRSEVESEGVSLKIDGAIGNYTFQSLTGYRALEDDLSTRISFPFTQQTDQDQFSQEYTISSNFEGPFNFVAGLFYFEEDIQLDSVFVFPFELGIETEAIAGFFQSNYEVSNSATLTTGIRFTDETKEINGLALSSGLSRIEERDFDNTTFNIALDNRFSESLLGYVSFSSGFKSGGWSPDCFSPTACFLPVDEEEIDSLEFGVRSDFFGGRLRLNASYFFNQYEGLQIGATVPGLGFTRFNVDEAEIDGLEVDATFRATENLTFTLNFGTLNADYTSLNLQQAGGLSNDGASESCGGVVSVECALDLELKNAPSYKGALGVAYSFPLSSGTLTAGLDLTFEDESFSLVANPVNSITDPGTLLDARLTYTPNDGGWRFALWGKNLGDEEFARVATGATFQYASDPLTWGVDIGYKF